MLESTTPETINFLQKSKHPKIPIIQNAGIKKGMKKKKKTATKDNKKKKIRTKYIINKT